jgi:hypothetical protein
MGGYLGLTVGWVEGAEVNVLGAVRSKPLAFGFFRTLERCFTVGRRERHLPLSIFRRAEC